MTNSTMLRAAAADRKFRNLNIRKATLCGFPAALLAIPADAIGRSRSPRFIAPLSGSTPIPSLVPIAAKNGGMRMSRKIQSILFPIPTSDDQSFM